MEDPRTPGKRTREAILPVLDGWLDRIHGGLTYRMTQMMTGHGCFGSYLFRIKKIITATCCHCFEGIDTPEHTLEECQSWEEDRGILREKIGMDIRLGGIIREIVRSDEAWNSFKEFAEKVMSKKEEVEREREKNESIVVPLGERPDMDPDTDD